MSENKRITLEDRLNEVLEIQEEEKKQEIISDFLLDKDSQEDFEYARKTIKDMVSIGQEIAEELKGVAKESNQARHYEVLATLLKTTSENVERLLDIRKKKKEADSIKNIENDTNTNNIGSITNNTYVGTTADLLELIKNPPKTQQDIVDVTPEKQSEVS